MLVSPIYLMWKSFCKLSKAFMKLFSSMQRIWKFIRVEYIDGYENVVIDNKQALKRGNWVWFYANESLNWYIYFFYQAPLSTANIFLGITVPTIEWKFCAIYTNNFSFIMPLFNYYTNRLYHHNAQKHKHAWC